jgi:Ca2+-binding EF-hand superfamily protein
LRAKFREADADYSGFLSVDEFYACLLNMGCGVTRQEVCDLFLEFDADMNMKLDIDEFVRFFSIGEQIEFQS